MRMFQNTIRLLLATLFIFSCSNQTGSLENSKELVSTTLAWDAESRNDLEPHLETAKTDGVNLTVSEDELVISASTDQEIDTYLQNLENIVELNAPATRGKKWRNSWHSHFYTWTEGSQLKGRKFIFRELHYTRTSAAAYIGGFRTERRLRIDHGYYTDFLQVVSGKPVRGWYEQTGATINHLTKFNGNPPK